jgi:hypothetical protein
MQQNFILFCVLLFSTTANAQRPFSEFETDLTQVKPRPEIASGYLKPDHLEETAKYNGFAAQFIRLVKGVETPIVGLAFKAQSHGSQSQNYITDARGTVLDSTCVGPASSGGNLSLTIPLDSSLYQVTSGMRAYQLQVSLKCGVATKIIFDERSDSGQAFAIWQVATHAAQKLNAEVGLAFWKKKIAFVWPANGDYYNGNQVHITLGYQWDVVTHEMGHAIYDQAKLGVFGGGEHYIDRCYTGALALSEGWASFFSAWVNLDLRAADPAFEYMVPRRAPVRVENVPSDVCGNSTSEWRVFAFLWDLVDEHDDGETFSVPFAKLWADTFYAHASSIGDMRDHLVKKGWDSGALQTIWKLNFPNE